MPESVRVEMVSSEPAGYIDSDWNVIKRPEAGQDDVTVAVEVKFTVGDTSIVKEYSVPISAVYVAPEVDEEAVAAAHAAQSQKKLGMFVHYVQHFTQDPNGKLMTDVDALANAFDAEQFAKDMDAFGVEYVLFTCMHYNAETLYPSEVNRRWRPCSTALLDGRLWLEISAPIPMRLPCLTGRRTPWSGQRRPASSTA